MNFKQFLKIDLAPLKQISYFLATLDSPHLSSQLFDVNKDAFTNELFPECLFACFSDAEVPTKPCINGGNYNVTELSLKGNSDLCSKNGFNQISIRCQEEHLVQFLRECSNELSDSGKLIDICGNPVLSARGRWSIISGNDNLGV